MNTRHLTAAGAALIVLGAVWSAIGAVLVVVSLLYANPGSLPDWVDLAASDTAAAGQLGVLGFAGLVVGLAQVAAGLGLQRSIGWAAPVGLVAALLGGVVIGSWLVSGLVQGRPAIVLLPLVVAYAYAAAALAIRPR
jgi:hypothetical protein